ncbi:MAG: phosphoribosylanthranilate isomerase [Planctomycetota bacterium]|nr:phosphoribosylanthranilate isomerase [Planctomycetota bacterium]
MGTGITWESRARKRSKQRVAILFKIKICGITSVKDAQLVGLAGADAVGLNFYQNSPRHVDMQTAEKLVAVLRPTVKRVGLFVNSTADEINRVAEQLQLDFIQLHGDEPPELLAELSPRPILRAFRFGESGLDDIARFLEDCGDGRKPDAILVDSVKPEKYGGTGEVADWEAVANAKPILGEIPLVLAGGLTPFNVAEAIARVRPDAVDTASGVEGRPANKDPMLVRAFVNAAKKAFQQLESEHS